MRRGSTVLPFGVLWWSHKGSVFTNERLGPDALWRLDRRPVTLLVGLDLVPTFVVVLKTSRGFFARDCWKFVARIFD